MQSCAYVQSRKGFIGGQTWLCRRTVVIIRVTLGKSFHLYESQLPPVTQAISGEKMEQGCDGSQKPSFFLRELRKKGSCEEGSWGAGVRLWKQKSFS